MTYFGSKKAKIGSIFCPQNLRIWQNSSNFARKIVQVKKTKEKKMSRKGLLVVRRWSLVVGCWLMAIGVQAETIRVLRFVKTAGEESEVAIESLQKVVFTRDSVMLIAAGTGEATPMYKYDYRRIEVGENSTTEEVTISDERLAIRGEKFIRDGRLYIRRDGKVYDIFGHRVRELEN